MPQETHEESFFGGQIVQNLVKALFLQLLSILPRPLHWLTRLAFAIALLGLSRLAFAFAELIRLRHETLVVTEAWLRHDLTSCIHALCNFFVSSTVYERFKSASGKSGTV